MNKSLVTHQTGRILHFFPAPPPDNGTRGHRALGLGTPLALLVLILSCSTPRDPIAEAYRTLDGIRDTRQTALIDYLNGIKKKARTIRDDTLMTRFFRIKRNYFQLSQTTPAPPTAQRAIGELKESVQAHYIDRYLCFYDILCIDTSGDVFYTIRKQADYHKNIFDPPLDTTALAQHLRTHPGESFVDFRFYEISGEPSAFFVEPVYDGPMVIGWFALQYSINKINSIVGKGNLGRSGEVILVNRNGYMLTDSRFRARSTILKEQLADENVSVKFEVGRGHRRVIDYRGFPVLSSFRTFSVMGSEWLIIAKIHESEVLSSFFEDNHHRLENALIQFASEQELHPSNQELPKGAMLEVDMDEFVRADSNMTIYTHGVSTCTAVLLLFPQRFAYLAHVSVVDALYGGVQTDLISEILQRVEDFELFRYEMQRLEVVVVATHPHAVPALLEKFLTKGLSLSQITFVYRPEFRYVNIYHDTRANQTLVDWVPEQRGAQPIREHAESLRSMGALLQDMIR